MIKLDTENWKVETDCKTVGEFMTEASQFGLLVRVTIDDVMNYFFEGGQKVVVVDSTPLDKVLFDRTDYTLNARASFRVFTKPKPKTVKKSGWVNIYRDSQDGNRRTVGTCIHPSEYAANAPLSLLNRVAVARIEWEEVQE